MFVTIEGIDGSGKTSQVVRFGEYLTRQKIPNITTSEPRCGGYIPWTSKILDIIINEDLDAGTQILLINAARREHIEKVIRPAILSGKIVICDRFIDSSIAYQGAGFGYNIENIISLHETLQENYLPNITYLIDLPLEIAQKRMENRGNKSKFDAMPEDFFNRVRQSFLKSAEGGSRFHIINGNQSEDEVFQDIITDFFQRNNYKNAI